LSFAKTPLRGPNFNLLGNSFTDLSPGDVEVVLRLDSEEYAFTYPKLAGKSEVGLGTDRTFAMDNVINTLRRNINGLRQPIARQFHRLHEVLAQHVARMDRFELTHTFLLGVIVCYFHLVGIAGKRHRRRQLRKVSPVTLQGKPIGPNELLIAAHARALEVTVVTANEGEFSRVPGRVS
jgi:hypothetical protein